MPHSALLDPQGQAVASRLAKQLPVPVLGMRIGKEIQMELEAGSEAEAREHAEWAAQNMLANPVMEVFEIVDIKSV